MRLDGYDESERGKPVNVELSPARLKRIETLRKNMLVEPQVCVEKALYTTPT